MIKKKRTAVGLGGWGNHNLGVLLAFKPIIQPLHEEVKKFHKRNDAHALP